MNKGNLITDLVESVVRAELNAGLAEQQHTMGEQASAPYAFDFGFRAELVEVA